MRAAGVLVPVLLLLGLRLLARPVRSDPPDGWRNRTGCGPCEPDLCPEPRGCRAGLVPDSCGCCEECGNLEGQACDPGGERAGTGHGLCGTGMRCQEEPRPAGVPEEDGEERLCVCEDREPVCGSDGTSYSNMCSFREAAFGRPDLQTRDRGPCRTAPVIKVRPRSQVEARGGRPSFLCEVFAFPQAQVEWRKEGRDVVLPGDDPHLSVQSRGGPLRFELSSWLQIEGAEPADSGTYSCVARNALGSTSASADLGVLDADELASYLSGRPTQTAPPLHADYDHDFY